MKFLLSISMVFILFSSSANQVVTEFYTPKNNSSVELIAGPGKRGKHKRIKKRRKRKCKQFGRKVYAG